MPRQILLGETNVAQFACGFFCEENYTTYFFSIFIFGTRSSKFKVIWSANRDYPVQEKAILNFTTAGDLVLKDGDGNVVWTTKTAGKSVAGMNLTDTGNLVLFNDQNSEGMYSLQVTNKGLFAYVESNPPQAYYSKLDYLYGNETNKGRRYNRFLNGSLSLFFHSSEPSDPDDAIDIPQASSAQYMKLMSDGHLRVFEWQSDSLKWTVVADLLTNSYVGECGYPLTCGRNSICTTGQKQQCSCPTKDYFRPVNNRQLNMGCSEITPLTCNSTRRQHFITLDHVKYFTLTEDMEGVSMETCKQACLNNCSCKAAYFQYSLNVSSGKCFLPSEIFTMKNENSGYFVCLAFIKVQNVTSPPLSPPVTAILGSSNHSSPQVARVAGSIIGGFVLLLVVAIGIIMYKVHKRKMDAEMKEEYFDQVPGMLTRFSYEELKTATKNFSTKLGQGGYGSVFEGTLRDGTKIAVKCLEGLAHVKKSFVAEVQSIGSIHHVNLVRLCGFRAWKSQRWIYHGVWEQILEWESRKKIILDIAKGLAYLHEDCRQKIVHLDIKPQNILLDNDFNTKVSDFGLSKLIEKTQTEVMTTIKGTPGYIAPEWRTSIITESWMYTVLGLFSWRSYVVGKSLIDHYQKKKTGTCSMFLKNAGSKEHC
ncbi:G-type lectin S-receptor-like serine/threonine-protein kinase SD2-5 [Bidens hawaiensis]|uniref:G-type lectin S-receptor-like serine/threonine-protein kinase SD2-5 n=1 Tax=Bidens hawaiensis TaxID=980011 RepID=UPI004049E606